MKEISSIEEFREQSTWRLVGLGIITYGVYFAYYIKRQTNKINNLVSEEDKISSGFVNTILIMSYISLVLFFAYVISDEGSSFEGISNIFDRIWGVTLLVWGFKARNRLNRVYAISNENKNWFHGLWTFLFSPMYFNFKVNSICEEDIRQASPMIRKLAIEKGV